MVAVREQTHHLWKKRRGAEIKTKIPRFFSRGHQYPHTTNMQPLFLVALVEATVFGSGCDALPVKCHMTSVRRVDIETLISKSGDQKNMI